MAITGAILLFLLTTICAFKRQVGKVEIGKEALSSHLFYSGSSLPFKGREQGGVTLLHHHDHPATLLHFKGHREEGKRK